MFMPRDPFQSIPDVKMYMRKSFFGPPNRFLGPKDYFLDTKNGFWDPKSPFWGPQNRLLDPKIDFWDSNIDLWIPKINFGGPKIDLGDPKINFWLPKFHQDHADNSTTVLWCARCTLTIGRCRHPSLSTGSCPLSRYAARQQCDKRKNPPNESTKIGGGSATDENPNRGVGPAMHPHSNGVRSIRYRFDRVVLLHPFLQSSSCEFT